MRNAIIIIAVIVLAGGIYWYMASPANGPDEAAAPAAEAPAATE